MNFYSYLWLREDGTPYYAGKGSGKRAYIKHYNGLRNIYPPKDRTRVHVFPMRDEADAIASEIAFIDLFGRKDLGTGCLRNFTNGGDGVSGLRHTEIAKQKMSVGHKGRPSWNKGIPQTAEHIAKLSVVRKGKNKGIPRPAHVMAILHSPEVQARAAAARTGQKRSEDTCKKIGAAHLGRRASEETKKKLRESHKNQVPWNKGKTGTCWSEARRLAQERKRHGKLQFNSQHKYDHHVG